jgi:dTDP-4-amino-4,6-dideoxygalactose transaminase
MQVPITRPWFDDEDYALLRQPLENGWVAQGPFVAEFERAFCAHTGAAHAIACTSATTGLHLALAALGIGPGDEVVVPAFTWVATANAALYQGATPVLCDVDPHTFNFDPADLARRITPRTRAVIPVHLFGLPGDMAALDAILAQRPDIAVVEDAACGLGARIDGTHVGRFGRCGVFSFHPRKAITTGEGGMITTEDAELAATLRRLRNHGAGLATAPEGRPTPAFLLSRYAELGFNYRMTDIQGALGVSQMKKVPEIERRRARLAARYDKMLSNFRWLVTPHVPDHLIHGWQSYVVRFEPEAPTAANLAHLTDWRDALMVALEDAGVSTRPGTHAVSGLELYRARFGIAPGDFPGAAQAEGLTLALPLFPTLSDEEQSYVVETMGTVFAALPPPGR